MPNWIKFETTFSKDDIGNILPLSKGHPVWAVHGKQGGCVVVKGDKANYGSSNSVTFSNSLMGIVSPTAKAKPLLNNEKQALSQWLAWLGNNTINALDPKERDALLFLQMCLNEPVRAWYKMEMVQRLGDLKEEQGHGKNVAKALNAKGGLEMLGKILAVDMFNSNNDRFGFERGVDVVPQGAVYEGTTLNYLANIGNIIIRHVGEGAEIVGMDAFDPASRTAGLQMPGNPQQWKWAYDIFNPNYPTPRMIDTVAERCIEDLNTVIGKQKKAFLSFDRLGKDAPKRMANGMREGAKIIESSFRQKYGNSNIPLPPGVLLRGQRAGWTWMVSRGLPNQRVRTNQPTF